MTDHSALARGLKCMVVSILIDIERTKHIIRVMWLNVMRYSLIAIDGD